MPRCSGSSALPTTAPTARNYSTRRDAAGNFLNAETKNLRVRAISAFAGLDASAGSLAFGAVPVGYTSSPQTLVLTGVGPLEISSISTTEDFIEYDEAISLTGTSP